ncbi:MAG: glycosyltransferase [Bacillota bacterium]|nr:glycosyltransferase [Bacillota bacterium]
MTASSEHLNILLATMALDVGGAETHVVTLAKALARRGHRVEVASAGGRLVPQLARAGIPHHVVPLSSRAPWALGRAILGLTRLLRQRPFDVVHAHARIPAWVADHALRRVGVSQGGRFGGRFCPLVTTYHGPYAAGWFWRRFTRWGDAVIVVSEHIREHVVDRLKADPQKVPITIIPNGIDLDDFAAQSSASQADDLDLAPDAPVVLHVSRLSEAIDTALALIGSAPVLYARHPGLTLLIAGTGTRFETVRRAAEEVNRRLGRGVVRMLGARFDIPALQRRAWLTVAVGRAALEAMAAERPVIISGTNGYGGILAEDRLEQFEAQSFTAYGFGRPITPETMLPDLERLLTDANLRQSLGRWGAEVVSARYSVDRIAERVEAVYRRALEASARQPAS